MAARRVDLSAKPSLGDHYRFGIDVADKSPTPGIMASCKRLMPRHNQLWNKKQWRLRLNFYSA